MGRFLAGDDWEGDILGALIDTNTKLLSKLFPVSPDSNSDTNNDDDDED